MLANLDIKSFVNKKLEYREADIRIGRILQSIEQPTRSRLHDIAISDHDCCTQRYEPYREDLTQSFSRASWGFPGWGGNLSAEKQYKLEIRAPQLRSHRLHTQELYTLRRIFDDPTQLPEQLARARLDSFLEGRELYFITGYDVIVNPEIRYSISGGSGSGHQIDLGSAGALEAAIGASNSMHGEILLKEEYVWSIEFVPIIFTSATAFKLGRAQSQLILDKANDSSHTGIYLQSD